MVGALVETAVSAGRNAFKWQLKSSRSYNADQEVMGRGTRAHICQPQVAFAGMPSAGLRWKVKSMRHRAIPAKRARARPSGE